MELSKALFNELKSLKTVFTEDVTKYKTLHIFVAPMVTNEEFQQIMNYANDFNMLRDMKFDAVHLFIPREPNGLVLRNVTFNYTRELQDFKSRSHFVDLDRCPKIFSTTYWENWYYWLNFEIPDAVPPFATQICGTSGIFVDDDNSVLLIREHRHGGKLKPISGAVELGETVVEALQREAKEEVGLLPVYSKMLYISGYHQASARPGNIGDSFYTFLVRVRGRFEEMELKRQESEVAEVVVLKYEEFRRLVYDEVEIEKSVLQPSVLRKVWNNININDMGNFLHCNATPEKVKFI